MNIVSIIMNILSPDVTAKIASALGLDRSLAQKAIGAAVPSLLAGFTGLSSKPEGARQLANSAGNQDGALLSNFAGMLGSARQGELISNGTSVLTQLLGGQTLGSLTGAIAKFAGIGEGASKSLVGLVGPIVLGQLGREKANGNLDASGLAALLDGQKKTIAAALPPKFPELLHGTPLLDAVGVVKPATTGSRTEPASSSGAAIGRSSKAETTTAPRTSPYSGWSRGSAWSLWPLWTLAALAGALANWYFFGEGRALRHASVAPAIRSIMAANIDIGRNSAAVADGLAATLRGIRDVTSAQSALTKLQESAGQLNRISAATQQMSPESRRGFTQYFATFLPVLWPLLSSVDGIPGLPDEVRTTLRALQTRVDGLAR